MYYFGFAPHFTKKKLMIEGFNDVIIIILSYHLFCFTNFTEVNAWFFIGYSFVGFFMIIILVNLVFMVNNVYHRCLSKRRKKRYQKAYEARFAEFLARIECDKEEKEKLNLLKL